MCVDCLFAERNAWVCTANFYFIKLLEKLNTRKPVSVLYFDGAKSKYYIKRFLAEPTKEELVITDDAKSQLTYVSTDYRPMAEVHFSKRSLAPITVDFEDFIAIKGIKAQGNQFSIEKVKKVTALPALPYTEPVIETPAPEEPKDQAELF